MTAVAARAPGTVPKHLIFDGQSHNNVPTDGGILGQSYPWHVTRGRGVPWSRDDVAINGQSWTTLALTAPTRLWPLCSIGTITVLVMSGGTADINEGDSGQQVYDDHVAYADLARVAGATHVVACTLLGSTSFDATENTRREAFNQLLLADADEAFDAVADVDAAFVAAYGASYWTDTDVLFDGTHLFAGSAELYAQTVAPHLDTILA